MSNMHIFDRSVDVLVVGSGGGGMTAAMRAKANGLDTLLVEKTERFGATGGPTTGGPDGGT